MAPFIQPLSIVAWERRPASPHDEEGGHSVTPVIEGDGGDEGRAQQLLRELRKAEMRYTISRESRASLLVSPRDDGSRTSSPQVTAFNALSRAAFSSMLCTSVGEAAAGGRTMAQQQAAYLRVAASSTASGGLAGVGAAAVVAGASIVSHSGAGGVGGNGKWTSAKPSSSSPRGASGPDGTAAGAGHLPLTSSSAMTSPEPLDSVLTSLPLWIFTAGRRDLGPTGDVSADSPAVRQRSSDDVTSSVGVINATSMGVSPEQVRGLAELLRLQVIEIMATPEGPPVSLSSTATANEPEDPTADTVMKVQPAGPYALLGIGNEGCRAAFKLASHLDGLGHAVMLLLLGGSPASDTASLASIAAATAAAETGATSISMLLPVQGAQGPRFRGPTTVLLPDESLSGGGGSSLASSSSGGVGSSGVWVLAGGDMDGPSGGDGGGNGDTSACLAVPKAAAAMQSPVAILEATRRLCSGAVMPRMVPDAASVGKKQGGAAAAAAAFLSTGAARAATAACVHEALVEMMLMV